MNRLLLTALALATLVAPAGVLADPAAPAAAPIVPPAAPGPVAGAPAGAAPAAEPAALTGPQVGAPAPAFSLKTIDGTAVSLDSYKGKTLVINVWATWCPPCRQEMPDLIKTAPKLEKSGTVAFLGVDTTEKAPIVRAYAVAKGLPYPQAIDADKSFQTAYDVQYFPTTYVIDPQGTLRARYIDVIAPAQLTAFVEGARQGRTVELVSPLQKKIDATIAAVPLDFGTDPATVEANAKKANDAIAAAEKLMDNSDAATGNPTDLLRTRAEEATLRDAAIGALTNAGAAVKDASLLPLMRGDAASDHEQWNDAVTAYTAALAIDPKNEDALGGLATAAYRLDKSDVEIDADTKLAALEPNDPSNLVGLARAQARAGHESDAVATFANAVSVAKKNVAANPGKAKYVRVLAWTHLYYGRNFAAAGDTARARAEFDQTLAYAEQLPRTDERHDMYLEEGQEAIVALDLGTPAAATSVTLVPWTGADLPGSIPNTIKYRLVVADVAGRNVALKAIGVPKGWVASFCSDRVCAPFRVSVTVPSSGVKVVEFQLVPPGSRSAAPKVRVTGTDGQHESTATT
jgi:peroxiredoxin